MNHAASKLHDDIIRSAGHAVDQGDACCLRLQRENDSPYFVLAVIDVVRIDWFADRCGRFVLVYRLITQTATAFCFPPILATFSITRGLTLYS
jgi:hypothetical protein